MELPPLTAGVAAYSANDVEAMLKVYAPDGILQGTSEPQINVGSEAIRKYFRNLPNSGNKVTIQERRMVVINDTTVLSIGFYTFRNPARFSFLVVRRERLVHRASSLVVDPGGAAMKHRRPTIPSRKSYAMKILH